MERWQREGITHILVNRWGVEFVSHDPRFALSEREQLILSELEGYLEPIYEDERENYILYEVRGRKG